MEFKLDLFEPVGYIVVRRDGSNEDRPAVGMVWRKICGPSGGRNRSCDGSKDYAKRNINFASLQATDQRDVGSISTIKDRGKRRRTKRTINRDTLDVWRSFSLFSPCHHGASKRKKKSQRQKTRFTYLHPLSTCRCGHDAKIGRFFGWAQAQAHDLFGCNRTLDFEGYLSILVVFPENR